MGPGAQRGRQAKPSHLTIWQRIDGAASGCGCTEKCGDTHGRLVDAKIGPVDQNRPVQYVGLRWKY
jgi:hypothetical protein